MVQGKTVSAKGIYSALSGAIAQNQKMDTIANNLANVSTTGFKKDQQTFYEYVTANEKGPEVLNVPRITASVESFYDMNGGDRAYVDSSGTFADQSQGALKNTGGAMDIAIEGKGFLEVATAGGVRYTRNGALKMDGQGRLVTNEGLPVLREGNGDPNQRTINLSGKNITISYSGEIFDGDQNVGKLSVVEFADKSALKKQGSSLFSLKENYNQAPIPAQEYKLHQGFIELSNVNVVSEMTEMIQSARAFEATQNAIKAFDQMDEKLVNVVPRSTP